MTAVYEGLASNVLLSWGLIIIARICNACSVCDFFCKNTILIIIGSLVVGISIVYILFAEARKNADTIVKDLITMNMDCE